MNVEARLIKGSVPRSLLSLTLPMIWGLFTVMVFNLADTFFIGKLGTKELAAMGFTFPIITFFGNASIGLGIGASSVIARALGAGDSQRVKRLTTDAFSLALLIVAVFLLAGYVTMRKLFTYLGAEGEILEFTLSYMKIWYGGMIFLVVPMVGNNIIRATGNAFFPAFIMTTAATINIIFDPILIFGFGPIKAMGVEGAAWATVISRAMTMIASLGVIHFRYHLLDFSLPRLSAVLRSWKDILAIGLPTAGSNVLIPLSLSVVTGLVASFGHHAVAAFGIVVRVELLSIIVIIGLSQALGPFVGQNFGAERYDRLKEGLDFVFKFSFIWGCLVALILMIYGQNIVGLFDDDKEVMAIGGTYLLFVPLSYLFEGMRLQAGAFFNSLGKPLPPTLLVLAKMFLFLLPLSWLFSFGLSWGVDGIFFAFTVTNTTIGLISFFYMRKIVQQFCEV